MIQEINIRGVIQEKMAKMTNLAAKMAAEMAAKTAAIFEELKARLDLVYEEDLQA